MAPTIRIDEEVMEEIKKKAVEYGLVFSTPNEVLRSVFKLEKQIGNKQVTITTDKYVDIEIKSPSSTIGYHVIYIPKKVRRFFPGYKLPFTLDTNIGEIRTYVASAPIGTHRGDPDAGVYIQSGLRNWVDNNKPRITDGTVVRLEAIEPGKRYKLYIL